MARRTRRWSDEQGGATVEFALLSLVLVPTLLYAVFFAELSIANLKTQEAARYMVWEMTNAGLSDWQQGKHDDKFAAMSGQLLSEVNQRWGDDMDGATPTVVSGTGPKPVTLNPSVVAGKNSLKNVDAGVFDVTVAEGFGSGKIDQALGSIFGHFGFNNKGKVQGEFKMHIKNTFLGKVMPIGYGEKMLKVDELDLTATQSLIADQWDLKQGGGVVELAQSPGKCTSDYCKQVDRMAFLGFAAKINNLPLAGQATTLLGYVGLHWPLATVVASMPLTGGGADSSIDLLPADPPGHSAMRKHHTNVFKDTFAPGKSEYNKVYKRLGPHYMGCKQPQIAECKYN